MKFTATIQSYQISMTLATLCLLENEMFFAQAMAQTAFFIDSCLPATRPGQPCFPQRCSASQKHSRKFGNRVSPQPDLYCSVPTELDLLSATADSSSPSKLLTWQLRKVS